MSLFRRIGLNESQQKRAGRIAGKAVEQLARTSCPLTTMQPTTEVRIMAEHQSTTDDAIEKTDFESRTDWKGRADCGRRLHC